MKNRLFQLTVAQQNQINETKKLFSSIDINNIVGEKISDHQPVIHHGVLFWNIMMQGKMRRSNQGVSFNNGFGIIETDEQYKLRLKKVAVVIAKIIFKNPHVETIGLCEGPIEIAHIAVLREILMLFKHMHKFIQKNNFNIQYIKGYQNWGLLMLTNDNNQIAPVTLSFNEKPILFDKLANRFQLWKLTNKGKTKYIALAHFPFAGNEHITDKIKLSKDGKMYCKLITDLMTSYADEDLIMCADFNFNPYLIGEWESHAVDKIPSQNSILLTGNTIQAVTVDGILLSKKEKQKYYSLAPINNLFGKLAREYALFKSCLDNYRRHHEEKNFALVLAK